MLIGVGVVQSEGVMINGKNQVATINSCPGVIVPLQMTTRGKGVDVTVKADKKVWVAPASTMAIPIKYKEDLLKDRDFVF